MKFYKFPIFLAVYFLMSTAVFGFSSQEQRVNHYLQILDSGSTAAQIQMLDRMQWAGMSGPEFFDEVEKRLIAEYRNEDATMDQMKVMAYMTRSLGYSGNQKYLETLSLLASDAYSASVKRHAKKAKENLPEFAHWNEAVARSSLVAANKPVEIETYMKMLSVDDIYVQRLAARAIFHEHQTDSDLLEMAAVRLKAVYLQDDLDAQAQDTAAWLCKALGESVDGTYNPLLMEVAENTPHRKIEKYARQSLR